MAREADRIDDDDVAACVNGQGLDRLVAQRTGLFDHVGVLRPRVGIDFRDAAAGQDVMELVEADERPQVTQSLRRVRIDRGELRGVAGEEFQIMQGDFRLAVVPFGARLRRQRALMRLQIEFIAPGGQPRPRLRFQRFEE